MSDSDNEIIWIREFKSKVAEKFYEKVTEKSEKNPERPIIIHINSPGGKIHAMASMVETLESVPNPIVTACMGFAGSAGAFLLSFGDRRFCGPNSRVMIHETSSGFIGAIEDIIEDVKESERINKYWMTRLAKNCGMADYEDFKEKVLRQQDGRNVWLNSEEALKFGIVDHIGVPEIRPQGYEIINKSESPD